LNAVRPVTAGGTGASTVADARTKLSVYSKAEADAAFVTSDDLGTAAGKDVGTTAGTVAAGDDSRITGALSSSSTITDALVGRIQVPSNGTYMLALKVPFDFTISEITTKCESGSCTATFKINTTALGGTANSVSTTEQSQAQASANTGSAGDDIQVTISANSSCVGMSFRVKYTRALS
jgi:hypothetical protein